MISEKIICAVESWDSILDYWKPNCWSKSWLLAESGILTYPFSLFTETVANLNNKPFIKRAITMPLKGVSYVKYDDIDDKQKYLYLVPIEHVSFFDHIDKYGLSLIDERILEDVRRDRCKIILILQYEGDVGVPSVSSFNLKQLDVWCETSNIPYHNFYFIHGNILIDKFNTKLNIKVNLIGVSVFEEWACPQNFNPTMEYYLPRFTGKKIFLNYNRQPRYHRAIFCSEILRYNLLDCGLVSFNTVDNIDTAQLISSVSSYDKNLVIHFEKLKTQYNSRLILDTESTENLASNLQINHYSQALLSVVSETHVCEDMIFFSEKTWKPIYIGHPFILLGNPGSLKKLKEWGYKTFDTWIDERYDENYSLKERYTIVLRELTKLSKLSDNELTKLSTEMRDVCIHNKKIFFQRYRENFSSSLAPVQKIIQQIWDK